MQLKLSSRSTMCLRNLRQHRKRDSLPSSDSPRLSYASVRSARRQSFGHSTQTCRHRRRQHSRRSTSMSSCHLQNLSMSCPVTQVSLLPLGY
ncbi:hypothetical protein NP493_3192g00007 [Ridgeia piscesae]|uniref:Uncharacterized protein n=1 Tax=Ridgeia piscesae TaxID=27915 RepID=A0AAD9MZA2_RIDPI|nr:hypothetical protein NP493_3192g00007 [Ridgeia piscesae]